MDNTRHQFSDEFLFDTGAEISLVDPSCASVLQVDGTVPLIPVTGINGGRIHPSGSGILCLVPPVPVPASGAVHAGRDRSLAPAPPLPTAAVRYVSLYRVLGGPTVGGAASGGVVGAEASDPDFHRANSLALQVRDARQAAFPPTKSPALLAARFNLTSAAAIRTFVEACPYGVPSSLVQELAPTTDYSQGYATASTLKAPPFHASRYRLSVGIRDVMPHGHVWWTDISNAHPPD